MADFQITSHICHDVTMSARFKASTSKVKVTHRGHGRLDFVWTITFKNRQTYYMYMTIINLHVNGLDMSPSGI